MNLKILTLQLEHEQDVVTARRRAREIAELLGFEGQDQVRIATAVSEIARNAYMYAGGGRVEFSLARRTGDSAFSILVADSGPGIRELSAILAGEYHSQTGMGTGIIGSRRLMDTIAIETGEGKGTSVVMSKQLPRSAPAPTPASLHAIAARLPSSPAQGLFEEVRNQNRDLLHALEELRITYQALAERQEDLQRLNLELEETNRGVVALYAELDERAERLRNADATKSRFLSYMSHEFRTPLNGIIGLTRLLLERPSVREDQEAVKQVRYVNHAAEELTEMVNDLLDLAKAEAGKLTVHTQEFVAEALLGTVRSLFRPLQPGEMVELIFESTGDVPPLHTDESKLAQILRNLVSNALKFTERGEIRLQTDYRADTDEVIFSVSDTGIGIPEEFHASIFDEFSQVENPLQKKNKGTGLGLPLCKRLAELLGGRISLSSRPGEGSTFRVSVPRVFEETHRAAPKKVLIVDDEEISRYLLRSLLPDSFEVSEAAGGLDGLRLAREWMPDLLFLDLGLPDLTGWDVLRELRAHPATRDIPVVIATGQAVEDNQHKRMPEGVIAILGKDVLTRSVSLAITLGERPSVRVISETGEERRN